MVDHDLQSYIRYKCMQNREACEHFVDYEILDALPEILKYKYILSRQNPAFYWKYDENGKVCEPRMKCHSNYNTCDCSEKYPKTIQELVDLLNKEINDHI